MSWNPKERKAIGGYHRIVITPRGGSPVDVTFFRDVPTQLGNYSQADPFGPATAQITFPQITPLDDFSTPTLCWLAEESDVDIWWIPAEPQPEGWDADHGDKAGWMNPLTSRYDLIAPAWEYERAGGGFHKSAVGFKHVKRGSKVWEGFIASLNDSLTDTTGSISVQCQGALFEDDQTLSKPFYPPRPQSVESLIVREFDHRRKPSMHLHRCQIHWPAGWSLVAPPFTGSSNVFDPNVSPGAKWTGYTTRQTGSWDHSLTSYIQNMLAVMLTKPGSGGAVGDQWTLRLAMEGDPDYPAGRTPVLKVRERSIPERVSFWAGMPGVQLNLSRDTTQKTNAVYGTGTDIAGSTWRNAVVSDDGSRTDYRPLAAVAEVYPTEHNKAFDSDVMLRESYVQYGTGFSETDGIASAELSLRRDRDPGYSGTITLAVDPSESLSRWEISAGDTLVLKGYRGTGSRGMRFHVAQVSCDVVGGTVTLTVDTRYRDLLTLQQAINRMRDALTPAKLLNLNRNTVTIEDIQAPWDYTRGSGCVPHAARLFYKHKPNNVQFPYSSWCKQNPPREHHHMYVAIDASNPSSLARWSKRKVLMSEKGSIRRSEFFLVDRDGNPVAIPFHVSLWYRNGINPHAMPNDGKTWSPFIHGAFEPLDPATGQPWKDNPNLAPDVNDGLVEGWGNYLQPGGYSPGLKSEGAAPTGLIVDEESWSFDCSANNGQYLPYPKHGHEPSQFISVWAMMYAEHTETVWLGGRLFREEPGTQ